MRWQSAEAAVWQARQVSQRDCAMLRGRRNVATAPTTEDGTNVSPSRFRQGRSG
jgi:hypothetical protein